MGVSTQRGRETSVDAAKSIEPNADTLRGMVYADVKRSGKVGLTCYEIVNRRKMLHQTISPRITELSARGWLRDSGKRRRTKTGREAIVWVAER